MSPVVIKTIKIRKRCLVVLVVLVFLSFYLTRAQNDRAERQAVSVMSPALASRVIVVDPGHGGADPGVVGKNGALEKEIALEVSRLLAANLAQSGAMVLMTRETDADLSDPGTAGLTAKKREDLERRVAIANVNRADLYISVHVNSHPAANRSGAQVFYQQGAAGGGKAGGYVQSQLSLVLKNTGSQPVEAEHYITKNTSMPAVVVELGYITNEGEEKLLLDPVYQGKLAWAIYAGAVKYFATENPPLQKPPENERLIQTFKGQEQKTLKEP